MNFEKLIQCYFAINVSAVCVLYGEHTKMGFIGKCLLSAVAVWSSYLIAYDVFDFIALKDVAETIFGESRLWMMNENGNEQVPPSPDDFAPPVNVESCEDSESEEISPLEDEEKDVTCTWWNGSKGQQSTNVCSSSTFARMGRTTWAWASRVAQGCASLSGDSCILSHEVGLEIPAVFIYETSELRMRPLLFPRIVEQNITQRRISIALHAAQNESNQKTLQLNMHSTVEVEYFDEMRELRKEHLKGGDGYCVQLLHHSLSDDCTKELH
jgi:hypothetical protein